MSGNQYRRQGPPSGQGGQQGSGNGYYRVPNNQYHHNNHGHSHNVNHNHGYGGRGFSRGGHYNSHGYGSQYNPRHGYHGHHNSRYQHHQSSYNPDLNAIQGSHLNSGNPHQTNTFSNASQYPYTKINKNINTNANNNINTNTNNNTNNNTATTTDNNNNNNNNNTNIDNNNTNIDNNNTNIDNDNTNKEPFKVESKTSIKNIQLFSSRRGNSEADSLKNIPKTANSNINTIPVNNSPILYNNDIKPNAAKRPLDINSLQPMKKIKHEAHSKVERFSSMESKNSNDGLDLFNDSEPSSSEIMKQEENIKKTDLSLITESKDSSHDLMAKNKLYPEVKHESKNETLGTIGHVANNQSDFNLQTEKAEETKPKTTTKDDISTEKHEDLVASNVEDDEDEPIFSKKRSISTEIDSKNMDSEEDDTDIENSIPIPSKKTRRLHRLMQQSINSDDDDELKDTPSAANATTKPRANSNSVSRSSRSQSPKPKKTSKVGRDASGRTLLQRMCAKGNLDDVKRLIQSGSNVNDADFAGVTPLHEAALEGYEEIATLLLDSGANINVQSGQMDKDTPLIDAVSNLHYNVVKLLLERGADPTLLNSQNENALNILETTMDEYDEEDSETLEAARKIKKLLNKYFKQFNGKNKLSKSNQKNKDDDAETSDYHTFNILRTGGSDSLHERIRANDVTFILNYVSSRNGTKIPPEALLLASKLGFPDIASLLIAFGADINYKDQDGRTPLMYAVGKNHLEMVKLLLSNQADIKIKDKKGRNVLQILEESSQGDSAEYKMIQEKIGFNSLGSTPGSFSDEDMSHIDAMDIQEDKKGENGKNGSNSEQTYLENESISNDKSEQFSNEEINSSKKQKIDVEKPEDDVANKNKKRIDDGLISVSSTPLLSDANKKQVLKPKKKHESEIDERKITPVEPTPEELEAKKLKELEAQKAREALEHQRHERKKLKQQEIAKRIDDFEKQREEEKKAEERESLERKRKEEEEQSKLLREQEESKKKEALKLEIEKRKLIRSYYPYVLKNADFRKKLIKSEIEKYLPLYVFKLDEEEYLVDLQLNLLLGTETFHSKYPQFNKRKVKAEEKQSIWNILWPLIGSFRDRTLDVADLQKEYIKEGDNFKELVINWIKLDEFNEWIKKEEFKLVKESIDCFGLCHAALSNSSNVGGPFVISSDKTQTDNSSNDLDVNLVDDFSSYPIRFGKRTRATLNLVKRSLW